MTKRRNPQMVKTVRGWLVACTVTLVPRPLATHCTLCTGINVLPDVPSNTNTIGGAGGGACKPRDTDVHCLPLYPVCPFVTAASEVQPPTRVRAHVDGYVNPFSSYPALIQPRPKTKDCTTAKEFISAQVHEALQSRGSHPVAPLYDPGMVGCPPVVCLSNHRGASLPPKSSMQHGTLLRQAGKPATVALHTGCQRAHAAQSTAPKPKNRVTRWKGVCGSTGGPSHNPPKAARTTCSPTNPLTGGICVAKRHGLSCSYPLHPGRHHWPSTRSRNAVHAVPHTTGRDGTAGVCRPRRRDAADVGPG